MKISIHVDTKLTDTEISISCNRLTPEIEKVLATLRILDRQVTAMLCMLGACVIGFCGKYKGKVWWNFLAVMAVGILISMFNTTIEKVARITYSWQIYSLIGQVEHIKVSRENVGITTLNIIVASFLFLCAYKRCGLK